MCTALCSERRDSNASRRKQTTQQYRGHVLVIRSTIRQELTVLPNVGFMTQTAYKRARLRQNTQFLAKRALSFIWHTTSEP
jgi:hypothetical protein